MDPQPAARFRPRFQLLVLLSGLMWIAAHGAEGDPLVTVTGGEIRGRRLPDSRGMVFKGIPFARPPVGNLRWREPQPVEAWTGVREAAESGPPAAQGKFGWNDTFAAASREDCLYLDVWTPARSAGEHLPVMVWLHGGGNIAGAGGFDPLYNGTALIGHGVVLVEVEYRLGIFGFLSHPELTRESPHHASGNYGLMDQIAALEWVRDNIARFGGDPKNVTLFGQSAGAFDVMALLGSPRSAGLFHRAIAESGAPAGRGIQTLAQAEQAGRALAEKLRAPDAGQLEYLRSLSTADLLRIPAGFGPFVADGWVIPSDRVEVLPPGGGHRIPLIIGTAAIEIAAPPDREARIKMIRETFGGLAPKALQLYGLADGTTAPGTDPLYGDAIEQLGSDLVRSPAIIQGERHSAAGNAVWEYEFDRAIPPRAHAAHSSDLPYVFGNLLATGSQGGEFQDADRKLSELIETYWTNFARNGDPNAAGIPAWPKYDSRDRKYLMMTPSADLVIATNERGEFTELFREHLNQPSEDR